MSINTDANLDDPFDVLTTADVLRRKSIHGTLVTAAGQVARMILQLGSQILLARLLVPGDFGLLAMVYPLITFIQLFADIGFGEVVIQRPVLDQARVSALFWLSIGLSTALAVVAAGAAWPLAWFYGEPGVKAVMPALALVMPVMALSGIQLALLMRRMRFGEIAAVEVATSLLGVVVTVLAALAGWGYWSLVGGFYATAITTTAAYWRLSGWRPDRPRLAPGVGADLAFGGNLMLSNIANFVTISADNLIIGSLNGRVALGLYDRSYRLVVQPIGQLLSPVSRVMIPLLSRLLDQPDTYRKTYLTVLRGALLAVTPGILVCVFKAQAVIDLLLGPQWRAAGPVFAWICVGGLASAMNGSAIWLFVSQARIAAMRRFTIITSVLSIASFAIGAQWGLTGVAAWGGVVFLTVSTPLMMWAATRHGPVRWGDIVGCVLPVIGASILASAAIGASGRVVGGSGVATIIVAMVVAYACFLAMVLAVPAERRNLVQVLRLLAAQWQGLKERQA